MAYLNVRAQLFNGKADEYGYIEGGEISEGLKKALDILCPDLDYSNWCDENMEEKDETGEIVQVRSGMMWIGEEEFTDEETGEYLEGEAWDAENNASMRMCLEYYIALYPLELVGAIIYMSISDGSQFGLTPSYERAMELLEEYK